MIRFQEKNRVIPRQLLLLLAANLVVLFVGMGVFPLLPFYAQELGASKEITGIFLAIIYLFNAAGPLLNGWLVGKVSRRVVFIVSGAAGVPALALMGLVQSFWPVVLLTSIVWFSGGVIMAITSAYTGMISETESLGKSFSLMAVAGPFGSLLGGAAAGKLISWQGYAGLFVFMALVWSLLPLIGWLALHEVPVKSAAEQAKESRPQTGLGRVVLVLLIVSALSAIVINIDRLGISLSMQAQDLSAARVGDATTISGLLAVPVTLLFGVLSDRLGYKRFLGLGYLMAASGALMLMNAEVMWQFGLAASLILVSFSVNGAMASALLTEKVPEDKMEQGLSWMNAANSAAGIVSFAGSGYGIEAFGLNGMYLGISVLAVAAAAILELVPGEKHTGFERIRAWAKAALSFRQEPYVCDMAQEPCT